MSKPAAIQAMQLYGIPKSEVAHAISKYPSISQDFADKCLEDYFLLYAAPSHFKEQQSEGIYYQNDKQFVILYQDCTRWQALHHNGQLKLSFRAAKPEYKLNAYVLVSLGEVK